MRKLLCLFLCVWGLSACTSCRHEEENGVSQAAETYYRDLIEGRYAEYVAGIAYCDSMTDAYRNQMVDLVAQHVAREKERRGGPVAVRALSDTILGDVASVFLEITFGDSTREEVALPMVKCGGQWKMQ